MIVDNIDYNLIYDIISENHFVDYISEITIEDTIEYENGKNIQKDVIVIYYKGINHFTDEFFIDVEQYQERLILLRDMKIDQILNK